MYETLRNRETTRYLVLDQTFTKLHRNLTSEEIRARCKEKGYFGHIFHFIILRDGTIEEGRPVEKLSPVPRVLLEECVSVLLVGGSSIRNRPIDNFTPEQKQSVRLLTDTFRKDHPDLQVILRDELIRRDEEDRMVFDVTPYNT